MPDMPFFREAGKGRSVICLHSSASSGGQWRSLMEALSTEHRVICPDLYGYGKNGSNSPLENFGLLDEVAWLEPVLRMAGESFSLVGHSYGGLIALLIAVQFPSRVRSVVIYEPATWSVAVNADPSHPGAREIDDLRRSTIRKSDAGQAMEAAEEFVRYWAGNGAWEAMPPERREITASGMRKVRYEFAGEMAGHEGGINTIAQFAKISVPLRYFVGSVTKASVKRVAEVLAPVFENGKHDVIEGLGHMGPVTHPGVFNRHVEGFLFDHG